jgi:predicted Zn-dependent protease with MMP-like domain
MDRLQFNHLVDEALGRLPRLFKDKLANVAIMVEDYPDSEVQSEFSGLLLGLFHGVPKTHQTIFWASMPGQIVLYQKNIESVCRNDDEIQKQIEKTLKHEIGHYFGLTEKDLRSKGY